MERLPYRAAIALTVVGALFLDIVQMAITHVALPAVGNAFDVRDVSRLQWVGTAYLIAHVAAAPIAAWMVGRVGPRTTFATALGVFAGASALSTAAWSLESLVAFRALQGAGGGLFSLVCIAILSRAYSLDQSSAATGLLQFPAAMAPMLAPVLGGLCVTFGDWRWIFALNCPLALLLMAFGVRRVRNHEEALTPLDVVSIGLRVAGLSYLTYVLGAIDDDVRTSLAGLLALVASILFVWIARRRTPRWDRAPLFGTSSVAVGSTLMLLAAAASAGLLFTMPLLLQLIAGMSAVESGLVTAAYGLGVLVAIPTAPHVWHLVGPRGTLVTALLGIAAGALGLARLDEVQAPWTMGAILLFSGLSSGLSVVPLQVVPLAGLAGSLAEKGRASLNVARQVGLCAGVPLMSAILAIHMPAWRLGATGSSTSIESLVGFRWAFLLLALMTLSGAAMALALPSVRADERHGEP